MALNGADLVSKEIFSAQKQYHQIEPQHIDIMGTFKSGDLKFGGIRQQYQSQMKKLDKAQYMDGYHTVKRDLI